MTIQNFASFEADTTRTSATSKLVKAWEAKNAKRAVKASGVSLMALSLSACGSEDNTPFAQADIDSAVAAANAAAATAQAAAVAAEAAKAAAAVAAEAAKVTAAETAQAAAEATATAATAAKAAAEADAATAQAAQAAAETAQAAAETAQAAAEAAQAAAEAAQEVAEADAAIAAEAQATAEAAVVVAEAAQATAEAALAAQTTAITDAGFADLDALIAAYQASLVPATPTLTAAATDAPDLTLNSDTIDASLRNSLQTGDSLIDGSGADADVLNASVTVATAAPTLRNIETVNVTGEFLATGLDLTNTVGTDTLNLSTLLAGGTATVVGASAAAASNIVIGSNVATANVTAVAAGTGAAGVSVNAGASTAVNVNDSAGADIYTVTAAADATITSALADAGDSLTLNIGGDTSTVTNAALGTLNINSAVDATVTETTGLGVATDFTGAGDIILSTTGAIADAATEVTSTGAGSLTLTLTTVLAGDDVSNVAAEIVNYAHAGATGLLTISGNSTLNMVEDATGTIDLDAAGTLVMTVSEDQAALTTGVQVTSLTMSATPDEASDTTTTVADDTDITITTLTLNAATTTVAIIGSDDLAITTLANNGGEVISAGSMTGDLTLGAVANAATIFLGTGTNSVTVGNAAAYTIAGNSGVDTIDMTAAAASTVTTADGDDVITLSAVGVTTLDAGAGDDTVTTLVGAHQITLGAGADSVITAASADGYTIADFVAGTDTITLTGAAAGGIDLSNTAVTAGAYNVDGVNFAITLTGSTATDLQDSIILGSQATAAVAAGAAAAVTTYTALATGGATVAGDGDDVIAIIVGGTDIVTTGSGNDTVIADTVNTTTVTDFVMGTDTLILTGIAAAAVDLTSVTPTAGAYSLAGGIHTLTGNTATDLSGSVVLGTAADVFTVFVSATGGTGNDYLDVRAPGDTVVFIDNGGVDTITGVVGGAAGGILDFDSLTGINGNGVVFAAAGAKVGDAVDGEVYVFDAATLTGVNATFDFNGANNDAALGSAEVLASAAAYLEAALTEANGENYVALINTLNTGVATTYAAYLVQGDADGIDANDLTLLGSIDSSVVTLDVNNIA